MLTMRLQRYGRKNQPEYRVVVTDSRNGPRTGKHVDVLGSYQPKLGTFQIDGERARNWISKGVQVSDTVYNFLISEKVIEGKKKNVLSRKSPIIDEAKLKADAEAKAKAEAEEKARQEAEAKVAEEPVEVASAEPTIEITATQAEEAPVLQSK